MEESRGIMSGKHQSEFKVEPKVKNTDDRLHETYSSREALKGDDELTNHSYRKGALL